MKRLHVHVAVDDITASTSFYSALFSAEPTVLREDYAKWMLDDPRVNFAISQRGATPAIEHLGIQAETQEELGELYERLHRAERPVFSEGVATCCYTRSEKTWTADPQGIAWEAFLTNGESETYGREPDLASLETAACCTPETPQGQCCAPKARVGG